MFKQTRNQFKSTGGLNMKSRKKILVVGIVVTMVFVGAMAAMAGDFPCRHRKPGFGHGFLGLKAVLELKLSESQQTQVLDIIGKYEDEMKNNRDNIREARKNFMTAMHAEVFDEGKVRTAFKELSSIREESIVSRGKMMSELKAVLTPEQMALLKERKVQRMERKKARLGARLENLGE
jgi:Spy/CpxP family protein refolding chaperone